MGSCEFIEINEAEFGQKTLHYEYLTEGYYDVSREKLEDGWNFTLRRKEWGGKILKSSYSELFKPYAENSKVYQCTHEGAEAGWLHIGFDVWNNRVRIWDILVPNELRRQKIGSQMIEKVVTDAKALGARMIVLETQSCNVPAIRFYLKHGFDLVGFETLHYSNEDVLNKSIRMEFGLVLD